MIDTATLQNHADLLNTPGQSFRLYVGFGHPVPIVTDARLETPPKTYYPEKFQRVPIRPAAIFGPNRISFVGDVLRFYGGRSANRWRRPCSNHTWKVFKDGVDVTNDFAYVSSTNTTNDFVQTYPVEPQPAVFTVNFAQPGIYQIQLTVTGQYGDKSSTHTGYRQVIVYPSRMEAPAQVVEISGLSGGMSQGGWGCSLRLRGDCSALLKATEVNGYIPVVIIAETYYEQSDRQWSPYTIGPEYFDGPYDNHFDDPRVLFNGYVDRGTIEVDVDHSEVRFDCRTPDMILEQAYTHVVGFFEHKNNGAGITFNDLMYHDVVRYMLLEKSNFGDYHDLRFYHNWGLLPWGTYTENYQGQSAGNGSYVIDNDQIPNQEYRDWTFNNGQFWSNIRDGADNQFEFAYFSREGALHIHPDRTMWYPQVFYDTNSINQWDPLSQRYSGAYSAYDEPLCRVPVGPADVPIATIADRKNPGSSANPWATGVWGGAPVQVPLRLTVSERLGAVPSYYKLVGNTSFWNEEWGADYPQAATDEKNGHWLLAGPWSLVQGKYWSDQNKDRAWRNLWRFAARGYAAVRSRYSLSITFGLHLYFRPADMIELIHSDASGRYAFEHTNVPTNWFEVDGIAYTINQEAQTWTTQYQLRQVTVYDAPVPTIPPLGKGSRQSVVMNGLLLALRGGRPTVG